MVVFDASLLSRRIMPAFMVSLMYPDTMALRFGLDAKALALGASRGWMSKRR